jgi:hypothetical protein
MSDNEDATAALWNSEVLSVKNPVGEPIPEFRQPSEEGAKVPSSFRRQDAGDVLPHQPSGPFAISKAEIFEGQVATFVSQSASKAGDTERLAGGSSDKKVNWAIILRSDRREVAMQGCVGIVMRQHGAGECLDFAECGGFPTERVPGDGRGFDAGAYREVSHRTSDHTIALLPEPFLCRWPLSRIFPAAANSLNRGRIESLSTFMFAAHSSADIGPNSMSWSRQSWRKRGALLVIERAAASAVSRDFQPGEAG